MKKPVVHLICNAHLDPVWQWRWEEGAAEAITTFGIAARLLREFPGFIFNHNEAILYRWVEEHNPGLFQEIRDLVAEGRWCIAGGWDLQPDVNMPGTEAIIRHAAEGRRYFSERFGAHPVVAYNFDSFGHSGGLPQILVKAGYKMYIHMRPGQKDLPLPSDLYRWQGVDGSEIAVYRIPFPAYNTFHNKAVERIRAAIELALKDGRDTPVFWGLGDHGGGATRKELEQIQNLIECERQVEIVHSSTERFYEAVRPIIAEQPVVTGELQRVFTGCYTSMSRLKRRMQRNLGELVQTEGARAATWWLHGQPYPAGELRDAWGDHLFNDFHDILPGSSIEPGELDALDLYGRSSETTRRLRLGAVSGFSQGTALPLEIPVTILNTNPAALDVPVEFEYMIDHVPKFEGVWHARMFTLDGKEISIQEEPPESLLLTDSWRRKLVFGASLPGVGSAHYRIEMHEGPRGGRPDAGIGGPFAGSDLGTSREPEDPFRELKSLRGTRWCRLLWKTWPTRGEWKNGATGKCWEHSPSCPGRSGLWRTAKSGGSRKRHSSLARAPSISGRSLMQPFHSWNCAFAFSGMNGGSGSSCPFRRFSATPIFSVRYPAAR